MASTGHGSDVWVRKVATSLMADAQSQSNCRAVRDVDLVQDVGSSVIVDMPESAGDHDESD